jgi:outer membrane protein insertion porin family
VATLFCLSSASVLAAPNAEPQPSAKRKTSLLRLNGKRGESSALRKGISPPQEWDGLKISKLEVVGLKKVEKDAVLGKIVSKVGILLSMETLRSDVQALFSMGYFEDIEFLGDKSTGEVALTVRLKERPTISKITFQGNEKQTTQDLEGVIKVKQWSILDLSKIKDDISFLLKHYEEKGFYLTKITYETKEAKPGEVELVYRIGDYEKVQIKKITFLNNRSFSDEQLKSILMETKEGGFFSFMNSSGNFKESAFKTDLQRLTYWYLDQGFVKFKYETPSVTISDDKKFVYITVYVEEGEKYQMGNIDFSGDLLFSREELGNEILLKTDDTFSISKRNADIQKLTEKYQDLGYAFTNVIPKMDVKDDTKRVDVDYAFEKGALAYFGEITIVGNTKTHDKVIRRELKIKEGELYNGTRLRQSRENVERLGYFQPGEVLFNSTTPKGKNDIVDVEVQIKERPTGTVTLGAGYGSVQGLFFTTTVAESNFLGRGQNLSLSTNISRDRRQKAINLGWSDQYFLDSNWSAGFDAYYVLFFIPSRYSTRRFGGNMRVGYPIFEYTNAFMTYKRERMKIEQISFKNPTQDDLADIAADDGELSSVILSVIRDHRNNRFETSGGNYQSASLETAGLGGDKRFFKWSLNNRYYTPVVGDLVFRNNIEYGQISSFGGSRTPPSERYYLGGPNNLRGFQFFSVGPSRAGKDDFNRDISIPLGGNSQVYSMFELEYPLIREAGLKMVTFFDVGNIYTSFNELKKLELRQNYGFGVRWFSPIGPLRFEWGFPLDAKPGEDSSVFQFFIGPPF